MKVEKAHVLPGELDGDTTWFDRQNAFEQKEIHRQVAFKRRHWPELQDGRFSKRPTYTYPHILPQGYEKLAFYGPIAEAILRYMKDSDIAVHTEVLNLKSSQAACLNILFPLKLHLELATAAFRPFLDGLESVTGIDFEYTGPSETTQWLGEPASGKRGQNRTSIDAAVFWHDKNNRKWATLIEWKYTEKSYGVCSAFSNAKVEGKARCRSLNVAKDKNPENSCLLTTGAQHRARRYWQHMPAAGISLERFAGLNGCPFQGPLYQLMRQHLLGFYMQQSGLVDEFEVVSMDFAGNTALQHVPTHLRSMVTENAQDVVAIWNSVLIGHPMPHISVDAFMAHLDSLEGVDRDWRRYIHDRYGV